MFFKYTYSQISLLRSHFKSCQILRSSSKRGCNTSSIIHSIFFQLIVLMHVYGKYERPYGPIKVAALRSSLHLNFVERDNLQNSCTFFRQLSGTEAVSSLFNSPPE